MKRLARHHCSLHEIWNFSLRNQGYPQTHNNKNWLYRCLLCPFEAIVFTSIICSNFSFLRNRILLGMLHSSSSHFFSLYRPKMGKKIPFLGNQISRSGCFIFTDVTLNKTERPSVLYPEYALSRIYIFLRDCEEFFLTSVSKPIYNSWYPRTFYWFSCKWSKKRVFFWKKIFKMAD